jgi:3-dehydroquinate synthase
MTPPADLSLLPLKTSSGSYTIHVGRGALAALDVFLEGTFIPPVSQIAVVTDAGLLSASSLARDLAERFPCHSVPAGETSKSLAQLEALYDFFSRAGLDRSSLVIALGGGVTGDLAGYAAASYLRGIRFIQVPTTLLAMVDSSVGGKTGINIASGKNRVGAFHQPVAVFADLNFLTDLPAREFAAGMAEVVKTALLGDKVLWETLRATMPISAESKHLAEIVTSCCRVKAAIVAEDERETAASGGRALLNLGHTFGHAIEKVAGYGDYLHGEAVALGLVAAARLSERLGVLTEPLETELCALLEGQGLPVVFRQPLSLEALLDATRFDKKSRQGSLTWILLKAPGEAFTQAGIDHGHIAAVWESLGAR